jgi:hypothetical protein
MHRKIADAHKILSSYRPGPVLRKVSLLRRATDRMTRRTEIYSVAETIDMTLVFQYGSNCSDAEINSEKRLCGDAAFVAIAETVEEFELTFDVQSKGRQCAAADIVRTPGSKVWGVLYEVPQDLIRRETAEALGRKSLDAIEAEGKNYKRVPITLRRSDGQIVEAVTYIVRNPAHGLKTSIDYVRLIVHGLQDRGVPIVYIDRVKAIAMANNPVIAREVEKL